MIFGILFPFLIGFHESSCIVNEMAIDINDIMNEKLMPASIFAIEGSNSMDNSSALNFFNNITSVLRPTNGHNFESAFGLMKFHRWMWRHLTLNWKFISIDVVVRISRQMMNNYMCNSYLAKQILNDIAPAAQFQHRIGTADDRKSIRRIHQGIFDPMLYDQGSRGYKDWLAKYENWRKLIHICGVNIQKLILQTEHQHSTIFSDT